MASIKKRGKKYLVRWRDPDGSERGRTAPDYESARRLRREIEGTVALGHRWEPRDAHVVPALLEVSGGELVGGVFFDFLELVRAQLAPGTVRHYERALRRFYLHLSMLHPRSRRHTLELLSTEALMAWFAELRAQDLAISTARLYLTAVKAAWDWAYDSEAYRAVTPRPPRRLGRLPAPASAPAQAPTWAQMDAAIAAARGLARAARTPQHQQAWAWRARLATLLRFTGLRVDSQLMQLRWEDFDLGGGVLVVRGELGKSRRERGGRLLPLSPHLITELSAWGGRRGFVVAPGKLDRHSDPRQMGQIWRASGVPERIWGVGPGRRKGNVHHAFRKGLKTGLARLGVAPDVRDYLVGHHRGIDERYVDLLEAAREAVDQIPPLREGASPGPVEPTRGEAVDSSA
ncbi:MAG TPA: hypothetical protein ENK18_07480 [Deltaproteobacteria bacterium]|nr:hypothetical protein [Deltaproteobacteria bacterium]